MVENPSQRPGCLAVDMAKYIGRIPPRFDSFVALVDWLHKAPFVVDDGFEPGAGTTCRPRQRSRIWPRDYNCWEATAHLAAEGIRLLPDSWVILIQDRTFGQTRHVWPTISFSGKMAAPIGISNPLAANAWYNDLFGGIHWAGDKVLRFFGGGSISDSIATAAGDSLPDWARTDDQKKAHDADKSKSEPYSETRTDIEASSTKQKETVRLTETTTRDPLPQSAPDGGKSAMDTAI